MTSRGQATQAASGDSAPTVLFRRRSNQNKSGSASYESSDDMWDDRILTDVYDRAVNIAREDVAKRLAMNTNSIKDTKMHKKEFDVNKKNKQGGRATKRQWKVGSECRAVYSEDGLEYEATVIYIDGDNCIISYVGYNNEEEVKFDELKPSLGKYQRLRQALEAEDINSNDDCEENSINGSSNNFSEGELKNNAKVNCVNKSKSKKNKKSNVGNEYALPSLSSFQFPSFSPSADLNGHIPLPPPPPFFSATGDNASQNDQSLSVMLISWYMSGYYTGLYQGQKIQDD
ncbi:survival motor neuron isoform X2 [Arctopsyche grandis]|uniref:survival motor neuron isoform X2 n=1 Tax=Arctopsyche grandis TaxID=121162 RepID=UPI00406D8E3F